MFYYWRVELFILTHQARDIKKPPHLSWLEKSVQNNYFFLKRKRICIKKCQ